MRVNPHCLKEFPRILAFVTARPYRDDMKYRDCFEYALFRCITGAFALPPFSVAEKGLVALAGLARRLPVGRGDVVRRQLAAVFPQRTAADLAGMTKRVYDHLGLTAAEIFCARPGELAEKVRIVPGWQVLDEALAQGRGAIVATGHLGNFELGGRILAARYNVMDVVKTQRNGQFDRYLARMRHQYGIRTVPMERCARAVLGHLRGNGVVTLLLDQDAGAAGVPTNFLGLPASTWPGAARFSIRTRCSVVPMAILRQPDRTHVLHIGEPLDPAGRNDRTADVHDYTSAISQAVESFIRRDPEQWFWVHRRWKGADSVRSAT